MAVMARKENWECGGCHEIHKSGFHVIAFKDEIADCQFYLCPTCFRKAALKLLEV